MNRTYEDKALDGFPSKKREAIPEVTDPTAELAAPPPHLDDVGVTLWHELGTMMADMKVLTAADWLCLTMLCDSYSTYVTACGVLKQEGMVIVTGKTGYRCQHPYVSIRANALDTILRISDKYGLTAISRRRLQAPTTDKNAEKDLFLDDF